LAIVAQLAMSSAGDAALLAAPDGDGIDARVRFAAAARADK
jgi:hypothetical protein